MKRRLFLKGASLLPVLPDVIEPYPEPDWAPSLWSFTGFESGDAWDEDVAYRVAYEAAFETPATGYAADYDRLFRNLSKRLLSEIEVEVAPKVATEASLAEARAWTDLVNWSLKNES